MDVGLHDALIRCETDLDGALYRFCGDEALYLECLQDFLDDRTIESLDGALCAHDWDDAFTAVHALKGLAGNMGFVPLFHATAEMVMLIRTGRTREIAASYKELKNNYDRVVRAICENTKPAYSDVKGERA